jgi:hypothetical protein
MIKITEKGEGIRPAGYPSLVAGETRGDLPQDLEDRLVASGAAEFTDDGKAKVMISQEPSATLGEGDDK